MQHGISNCCAATTLRPVKEVSAYIAHSSQEWHVMEVLDVLNRELTHLYVMHVVSIEKHFPRNVVDMISDLSCVLNPAEHAAQFISACPHGCISAFTCVCLVHVGEK